MQDNLGLVYRVARRFMRRGLTFDDLIGEGTLGLIRAAQEYDPAVGTRFSTYAYYWIREAIQAGVANTAATIRLPMHVAKLLGRWRRAEKRLHDLNGYPPSFPEVAAAMGLDAATQRLIDKAHRVARLQKEEADRAGRTSFLLLMHDEGVTAEESLVDREEREAFSRRLEGLERGERTILSLRFGLTGEPPLSLVQIGDRLGMTPGAIQKAVASAMRKLGRSAEPRFAPRPTSYESRVG